MDTYGIVGIKQRSQARWGKRGLRAALAAGLATTLLSGAVAYAQGGAGGGGGTGGGSGGGIPPTLCATNQLLTAPSLSGSGDRAFVQYLGSVTNCGNVQESATVQFTDVSPNVSASCKLSTFSYGLPQPLPAGTIETWFAKSGGVKCFNLTHTVEIETFVNGSEADVMIATVNT